MPDLDRAGQAGTPTQFLDSDTAIEAFTDVLQSYFGNLPGEIRMGRSEAASLARELWRAVAQGHRAPAD